MRGRGVDYISLDSMILNILKEAEVPMKPLGVSFKVNEKAGKIINLNVIKSHLDGLVTKKKVIMKVKRDESVHYIINDSIKI
ncbi:MAG TPA: hypothetical protein VJ343_00300 [archaeon]|nr:hypothetical protein [archaeon]